MTFKSDIEQLENENADNYNKNTTAHTDLTTHQTEFINNFGTNFKNENDSDVLGNQVGFTRLHTNASDYENSKIGYIDGCLSSYQMGNESGYEPTFSTAGYQWMLGDIRDIFNSFIHLPNSRTYIRTNSNVYFTYPNHIMNCSKLDEIYEYQSQGLFYFVGDGVNWGAGTSGQEKSRTHLKKFGMKEALFGDPLGNNYIPTNEIKEMCSSIPSISIKFSVEVPDDDFFNTQVDTGVTFNEIMVGISLMNQPIVNRSPNISLDLYQQQTDGFNVVVHIPSKRGTSDVADDYFPQKIDEFRPTSASIYSSRIVRAASGQVNTFSNGRNYPLHSVGLVGNPIEWTSNELTNSLVGCDTAIIPENLYYDGGHPSQYLNYKGPKINELKIEFGETEGYYNYTYTDVKCHVVVVYFNGRVISKFLTNRDSRVGNRFGFFNTCHLFPGLILNAPKGMIKIHNYSIDMD